MLELEKLKELDCERELIVQGILESLLAYVGDGVNVTVNSEGIVLKSYQELSVDLIEGVENEFSLICHNCKIFTNTTYGSGDSYSDYMYFFVNNDNVY